MASISEQENTKLGRTSRRQWLTAIAGTLGFGLIASVLARYMRADAPAHAQTIDLGNVDALLTLGSQRSMHVANTPMVLVRPTDAAPYALLMTCTHAGCPLALKQNKILCGCHGGVFDIAGRPEKGPPKKPLTRIPLWVQNSNVYVRIPARQNT
ncbi:MAG: Rieske 2Fe-2S domain-containing protein [bacterium]|nr:Rieske 2Fe-2S domain-containing protein [bacterium]